MSRAAEELLRLLWNDMLVPQIRNIEAEWRGAGTLRTNRIADGLDVVNDGIKSNSLVLNFNWKV